MSLLRIVAPAVAIAAALMTPACAPARDDLPVVPARDMVVTLTRSACYGSCPDYRLTIRGDGLAIFETRAEAANDVAGVHRAFSMTTGVLVPGEHRVMLGPEIVSSLFAKLRPAGFATLKDEYAAMVTDSPTYVLTLSIGGWRKTVSDYVGKEAGMPPVVTELENAVDEAADSARWVRGTRSLVPWLDTQGFDFHGPNAAILAAQAAASNADEGLIVALLDRGIPLDHPLPNGAVRDVDRDKSLPAGEAILLSALRRGFGTVFARLASSGWAERVGKSRIEDEFAHQAAGCSASLASAVASAGLAIDRPLSDVKDALATPGATALAVLGRTYMCDEEGDRLETARRLLDLGANPNHPDRDGQTAIFGVENLDLLDLLLARGADATVKAHDGQSAVFSSWTDGIVLRLLEAGASPVGFYDDGGKKTLRQMTVERRMPMVARWLDLHPGISGK